MMIHDCDLFSPITDFQHKLHLYAIEHLLMQIFSDNFYNLRHDF